MGTQKITRLPILGLVSDIYFIQRKLMYFMRIFTIFGVLISLISCSASYEELMNSNFNPESEFSKHLLIAYKEKAEFEAKAMHDWNSAKLYSEKALKAAKGDKIFPEQISYWKIPLNKSMENLRENRLGLIKAYNDLMVVYNDALILDPFNLAKGISSLDCWSEQQEENWQTWDIEKCRNDYLNAMHALYNAIAENRNKNMGKINSNLNKKKDSTSIISQTSNRDMMQIIYFDFDKSKLSNISINEVKDFVKKNKNIIKNYIITGHTDTKGSVEYNLLLSIERANVIKKILLDMGIDAGDIKIFGKGEMDLRIKTDDEIAHPVNRRAEISLLN